MLRKLFTMLVIVFAVVALSSCDKKLDEVVMNPDEQLAQKTAQIHQEIASNPEKFLPNNVIQLYNEKKAGGGLKNATTVEPKVVFTIPDNELTVWLNGEFERTLAWSMLINDYTIDQGIIITHYNQNYEPIGDKKFYVGWNNEYCVYISIITNMQNTQMKMSFSWSTTAGTSSFEIFNNYENNFGIWLPRKTFNVSWESCSGAQFGGLLNLNTSNQSEININVEGITSNTNDFIRFETRDFSPDSKVVINITDSNGDWVDKVTLVFPKGMTMPSFVTIPISFIPNQVFYQVATYIDGRVKYSDMIQKKCVRMIPEINDNEKRIYGLK